MVHHYRKIIRITGKDSPNVRLALAQIASGTKPTNEIIIPGVLPYADYVKRREMWDEIRQCIGLDAQFYEGAEILLFPTQWLNKAEELHQSLQGKHRIARAMGIDPAEGGDKSCWSVVDEYGLMFQVALKTPDTTYIPNYTIALMHEYGVPPDRVCFDRGGGGKEHADRLRSQGHKVRSVGFGETILADIKRGLQQVEVRREVREDRYTYKNRRAEMYGELSQLLDPTTETQRGSTLCAGFSIPPEYSELRRQLALIPKWYDEEGRLYLPPKQRRSEERLQHLLGGGPIGDKVTLDKLLGHSPDEADSLVLAVHAMLHKGTRITAGAY